jgi:hypothetical protein
MLLLKIGNNVIIAVNNLCSTLITLRVAALTKLELYFTTVVLRILQISTVALNIESCTITTELVKMLYAVT